MTPQTPMFLVLFLASGLCSLAITEVYRRYAIKTGIIDTPNLRSSHTIPTPRGGGIAIVISHGLLLAYAISTNIISLQAAMPIIFGGSIVAITGFLDDYKSLSSRTRFFLHLCASILALALTPQLPTLSVGPYEVSITGIGLLIGAITLTWLINLYNFMDGIDGIATTEAISVLFAATVILTTHNINSDLLILLTSPLLGFLILNAPPAKVFMGDGGSGYLGICIGTIAIYISSETPMNLWCWVILLGVFIVDSSWTLITRIATGQNWHKPHKSHGYQILSRKLKSHGLVTSGVAAINLVWLAPLAWLASQAAHYGLLLTIIAYLPLCLICHQQNAGKPST